MSQDDDCNALGSTSDASFDPDVSSSDESLDDGKVLGALGSEHARSIYQLMRLINSIRFITDLNSPWQARDFAEHVTFSTGVGTHFQTRRLVEVQGLAKYPKLRTDSTGNLSLDGEACTIIARELRILSLKTILQHRNVVDLIGIGWTKLSPLESLYMPVIYLEYAEHGNLLDYLKNAHSDVEIRTRLSLDVALGLKALHECGVAHGDIKVENILVFADKEDTVIAKIVDFGSSVITSTPEPRLPGGSPPWNAPEWRKILAPRFKQLTDVYSLGLLIWRVTLDGQDPFAGEEIEAIDIRKNADCMVDEARHMTERLYQVHADVFPHMGSAMRNKSYFHLVVVPRLIFQQTLCLEPSQRSLEKVVEILSHACSRTVCDGCQSNSGAEIGGMPDTWFIRLVDLPYGGQAYFLRGLENETMGSKKWASAALQAAWAYFDGFGTAIDIDKGIESVITAANLGDETAQGLVMPLISSFGHSVEPSVHDKYLEWVKCAARQGFSVAQDYVKAQELPSWREILIESNMWLGAKTTTNTGVMSQDLVESLFTEENLASIAEQVKKDGFDHTEVMLSLEKNTLLHAGVVASINVQDLRRYLSNYSNVDSVDNLGNTPLILALQCGVAEHAKLLLEHGAEASVSNNRGETPAHWLISMPDNVDVEALLELLVHKGADLSATAPARTTRWDTWFLRRGGSPLHWAVQRGHIRAVEALLSNGADIELVFDGYTAIDLAVHERQPKTLEVLLRYAKRIDRLPETPSKRRYHVSDNFINFMLAAEMPHVYMIMLGAKRTEYKRAVLHCLQGAGLSTASGYSPFRFATSFGFPLEDVRLLVDAGLCPRTSEQWETTLLEGTFLRKPSVTHYLIQRAIETSPTKTLAQPKELLINCIQSLHSDRSVIEALCDHIGCNDVDCIIRSGMTALMLALESRNYEAAGVLLDRGANVNALAPVKRNPDGTPRLGTILYRLLYVNMDLNLGPLRYLLEPMHDHPDKILSHIVIPSEKTTALHLASCTGNHLIFEYVLEKFCDQQCLNAVDINGWTPLHYAVYFGCSKFVKSLCKAGADFNAQIGGRNLQRLKRKTVLDFCHWAIMPTASHLRDCGTTEEECLLNRLWIAEYLETFNARRAQKNLWSLSIHVKLAFRALAHGFLRLLQTCIMRLESFHPLQESILQSLLIYATLKDNPGAIRLIIRAGGYISCVSQKGRSPLHFAAGVNSLNAAQYLLALGANPNFEDANGLNATSTAFRCGYPGLCRMMVKHDGSLRILKQSLDFVLRILAREPQDKLSADGSQQAPSSDAQQNQNEEEWETSSGSSSQSYSSSSNRLAFLGFLKENGKSWITESTSGYVCIDLARLGDNEFDRLCRAYSQILDSLAEIVEDKDS